MSYQQEYFESIQHPESFWRAESQKLSWFKEPVDILSKDENGMDRWFADGEMNTSYMALDAQILDGRGEQVAIYYDSPVTDTKEAITYQQLLDRVARFAAALANARRG